MSSSSSSSAVVIRRPKKRARREVEESSPPPASSDDDDPDEEMDAHTDEDLNGAPQEPVRSFLDLDTLPENGMEHILRHMSRAPRAKMWTKYIDVKDYVGLYDLKNDFGDYLQTRFSVICIGEMNDANEDFVWKELKNETLWTDESRYAAQEIVMKAGLNFTSLLFPRDCMLPIMRYDFADSCVNVRSLSIADGGEDLLELFGGRLESLHLGINPCIFEIATHCIQLRELTLNTVDLGDLERSDLWKKVGDTLQSLRVMFTFSCEVEIRKIRKYCRKLNRVYIDIAITGEDDSDDEAPFDAIMDRMNTDLAACLASYGKQLDYAYLAKMNPTQLREVAYACTDAEFEVLFKENECIYTQLEILGPQLKIAYVNFLGESSHHEDIVEGWKSCVHLKKLEILAPALDAITDLFMTPKPLLEELTLLFCESYGDNKCDVKEALDCIAKRCSSLEKLVVQAVNPQASFFQSIVYKNRSLRSFSVEFLYDAHDESDEEDDGVPSSDVSELINVFLKSPTLEKLEFSNSHGNFVEPDANIQEKLSDRGVQIFFNNIDFVGTTEKWSELFRRMSYSSESDEGFFEEGEEMEQGDGWPLPQQLLPPQQLLLHHLNMLGNDVEEMI